MSVINLEDRNIYKFKTTAKGFIAALDIDDFEYIYEKLSTLNDNTFSESSIIIMDSMDKNIHGVVHFHHGTFIIDLDKANPNNMQLWDLPVRTIKEAKRNLNIDKILV